MRVDHRTIRKRSSEGTPELELGKGVARVLEHLFGVGPVARAELHHRKEFDDLGRADHVSVIAVPLDVQSEALARRLDIVDPVEPGQRICGYGARGASLDRERLIEEPVICPVPEHGLGDELADQRPGERRSHIAVAQESDRFVSTSGGALGIVGDLLEERYQDLDAQPDIVAGLDERALLVVEAGFDRLCIRGEGAEQQEHARSKGSCPSRLQGPCRERSRTTEVAGKAQRLGAAQHPSSEIVRRRRPPSACMQPRRGPLPTPGLRGDWPALPPPRSCVPHLHPGRSRSARDGGPAPPAHQRRRRAGDAMTVAWPRSSIRRASRQAADARSGSDRSPTRGRPPLQPRAAQHPRRRPTRGQRR